MFCFFWPWGIGMSLIPDQDQTLHPCTGGEVSTTDHRKSLFDILDATFIIKNNM